MRALVERGLLITIMATLLTYSLAHGPEVEISELQLVTTAEGHFLAARVDPPGGASSFALTAVATSSGAAQLERRRNEAYGVVKRIPIEQDHSEIRFGAFTPYRIRLLEVDRKGEAVPLTLLFTGGVLLQRQVAVEGSVLSRLPWSWAVLPLGVLVLVAGVASRYHRRRGEDAP